MQQDGLEVFSRFAEVAKKYCGAVDSARSVERNDLVLRIYRLLPLLIREAIGLAVVEPSEYGNQKERRKARMSEQQWGELYSLLKEKLWDWNLYSQVFDPTKAREAIDGSLADDIADIYRDLKKGLVLHHSELAPPDDILWGVAVWFLFSLGPACNGCPTHNPLSAGAHSELGSRADFGTPISIRELAFSLGTENSRHQIILSPPYNLNFSSGVTTGVFSHNAWAMIWRSKGSP